MNYIVYASMCLFSVSLCAGESSPSTAAGDYDDELACIVAADGKCETDYVLEVSEVCQDCDIAVPEKTEISDAEAWLRSVGLKVAYRSLENPLKTAVLSIALLAGCVFIIQVIRG